MGGYIFCQRFFYAGENLASLERNFVDNVRRRLEALGMTQKTFSELIGVQPQAVSNWMNRRNSPELGRIERIAEVLQTTPEDLIAGPALRKMEEEALTALLRDIANRIGLDVVKKKDT